MARHTAIADTGETLVTLLRDRLGETLGTPAEREVAVALATPSTTTIDSGVRVGLFLYGVSENGHLRAGETGQVDPVDGRRSRYALDLHYLLTVYPPTSENDPTRAARSQHALLGQTMDILHRNAVVRGSELRDSTTGGDAGASLSGDRELRLSVLPESAETVLNIWNTFPDTPYHPSVAYLVGPVAIDAPEPLPSAARVERERRAYHVLETDSSEEATDE